MDEPRDDRPRPARDHAARSRRKPPPPRPRTARPLPADPPYQRYDRRTRRREQSGIRPLHVLLLAILVLGLIGLSARMLTGPDDGTARAGGNGTIAAASGDAPEQTEPEEPARVMARDAPGYADGSRNVGQQPAVGAAAYAALDVGANQIVLARNDDERRPIASLTKMMTGLLAIEAGGMGRRVPVSEVAAGVEPNKDGLIIGNRYPRGILLYSAMLASNNDAAAALGEDIGGSYDGFYRMMTERGRELGMTDTNYESASGLNDASNWSTARDQAIMLARAIEVPEFVEVSGKRSHTVRWPDDGTQRTYENHNDMLVTYPGTIAGKTGFTTIAGGCLAVAVRRGDRTIVGVVLNTTDIWGDMARLMDAAFATKPA